MLGLVAAAVALGAAGVVAAANDPDRPDREDDDAGTAGRSGSSVYRAFTPDSWWNTRLPYDAPLNPNGDAILDYLSTGPESGRGCLTLAGAQGSSWGQPIYWASRSDPKYALEGVQDPIPELRSVRIPRGAQSADNSDGSMTVFDRGKGYVIALTDADYDDDSDTWSASGATVTYLDSNGLHRQTGRSDEPRNQGTHRGNNGATMAVMWDEMQAGAIRHVLKVAAGPEVSEDYIFPMVGSDGDYEGSDPAVPLQGQRLRIARSVDLDRLDLDPAALVIAQALQRYGFYIGDSGGTTSLKLEDTVAEGRGQLWDLPADALCELPFTTAYWDVIAEDYDPTRTP